MLNSHKSDSVIPEILRSEVACQSRFFKVESLTMRFANGQQRDFERLADDGHRSVIIVAMKNDHEFFAIREFAAGVGDYVWSLPMGGVDEGETYLQAANRELQEELGVGARKLEVLREMTLVPSHIAHCVTVVLATGLYPSKLAGDEPESIESATYSLSALSDLAMSDAFSEARAIAALYLVRDLLTQRAAVFQGGVINGTEIRTKGAIES